jgi:hypothetical protein
MKTPRPDLHSYPKTGYAAPNRLALAPRAWVRITILCGTLGALALVYFVMSFPIAGR